jgi:leucyl/phenylalanyl-tRNA---protein transferase
VTAAPVRPPVEPPPTPWEFPDPLEASDDLVAVGGDLAPGTILAAYRRGLFPMHADRRRRHLGWWSPDPRGVLPLDGLVVHRSLRASRRRYTTTIDEAFDAVIGACRQIERPAGWITADIEAAYIELHELGWAHSVEVWDHDELVGGLYGLGIGALFAGESMFHRRRDASKVALVCLVEHLATHGGTLLDVQWPTPHLTSLGVVAVDRRRYVEDLVTAVAAPHIGWMWTEKGG